MIGQSDTTGFVTLVGATRMPRYVVSHLLGFVGAVFGGALGFYLFGWLYYYSFYGLMIPGAFLGGGCGLLARHASTTRGVICGIAAALFALFTEWRFFPFTDDKSLVYFAGHVTSLSPVTWLMVVVGAFIAYWLARDAGIWRYPSAASPKGSFSTKGPGEAA
jgi:hypothetical protein